jgi:hypothetical protein
VYFARTSKNIEVGEISLFPLDRCTLYKISLTLICTKLSNYMNIVIVVIIKNYHVNKANMNDYGDKKMDQFSWQVCSDFHILGSHWN